MFAFTRKPRLMAIMVLVLMLTVIAFPSYAMAAKGGKPAASTSSTVNYVALGDSIATGTVTYWSNITSYVTYFHQYLKSYYGRKTTVNLQNLAHDGDRTNELLDKLNTDSTFINAVSNADIITISIGGNNLMQAAEIPGFTNIDWALADQGVTDFKDQWGKIFARINELKKPTLKVIVATVYNPYDINPPFGYESDRGLHELTDQRLSQINDTIYNNTSLGYKVADTYTAFDAYSDRTMGEITYFYPSLFSYLLRNPHPNSTGQEMITDLHKTVFGLF